MIILGPIARGTLLLYKRPSDNLAPYRGTLRLPDRRSYSLRMRSHPGDLPGCFWYEGFVKAVAADDYANDQQLARYPALPHPAPPRWNLMPCQAKINPFPASAAHGGSPDLIGSVWVSRPDGRPGGQLFTILATHLHDQDLAMRGTVLAYDPRFCRRRPASAPEQAAPSHGPS